MLQSSSDSEVNSDVPLSRIHNIARIDILYTSRFLLQTYALNVLASTPSALSTTSGTAVGSGAASRPHET